MKKIISLILILTLAVFAFAACGNDEDDNTEKDYTLSIGVAVSKNLAQMNVSETVAAIVTDADGKIVLCRLDSVSYAVTYNTDGTLNKTLPVSNVAKGDSYGSMPAGTWYVQGAALESYVVGKTQSEVAAIAVDADGKVTDTELIAACSIAVTDLLKAIDNAFKSEHKVTFKASSTLKAGVNVGGEISDKSNDVSKNAQYVAEYAAVVMADGKVSAAILDTAEVTFNNITEDDGAESMTYKGTKREQGASYDSFSPMAAGTWYVQADAYAKSAVGKTASDIATLATEGVAGCTIGTTAYKAGIENAVAAVR